MTTKARRPRSALQLPTCPLCGTVRVQEIGRDGLQQQLTVLQCTVCNKTWRELISDEPQASDEEEFA
jgi:formate dehydrogenase maturation protein FdhE